MARVRRQGISYLVGPRWDGDNVVRLALHCIPTVESGNINRCTGRKVSISTLISATGGQFNAPSGAGHIKLDLRLQPPAALYLEQRPLNDDPRIDHCDDDTVRLCATVLDSDDLAWWLPGCGASVEVRKPLALRRRVARMLRADSVLYHD